MKVTLTEDYGDDKAGATIDVDNAKALHLLGNAKATRAEPIRTEAFTDEERQALSGDDVVETSDDAPPDALSTVAQLRQYAADHDIDLTGLTLKADILAAIGDKTRAPIPAGNGEPEGEPHG